MKTMESLHSALGSIGGYGIQLQLDYRNKDLTYADINPNATRIDLRHNKLINFHDWPLEFPFLTHLRLDDNHITSLTGFPSMPHLEFLSLSHNRLAGNISSELQYVEQMCPSLSVLNLNFNAITHLYIPYTVYLCARRNLISHFTGPQLVNTLGVCHLGNNRMQSFDKMPYFPNLSLFRTANNPISTLKGLPSEVLLSILGASTFQDVQSWNISDPDEQTLLNDYFLNTGSGDKVDQVTLFYWSYK